mmetsp:Transcript_4185/g.13337  ORF Transcript_4185/g.13337 Transcript_4185/m.13337 type:complete len:202 (-) Transcript_4185:775-1380(-)
MAPSGLKMLLATSSRFRSSWASYLRKSTSEMAFPLTSKTTMRRLTRIVRKSSSPADSKKSLLRSETRRMVGCCPNVCTMAGADASDRPLRSAAKDSRKRQWAATPRTGPKLPSPTMAEERSRDLSSAHRGCCRPGAMRSDRSVVAWTPAPESKSAATAALTRFLRSDPPRSELGHSTRAAALSADFFSPAAASASACAAAK